MFIFDVLNNLDDYKWVLLFLGVLGPWIIYITKTWIENFNNIQLERRLNSNLINFYNELFIIIATFVSLFFILLIISVDEIEKSINDSSFLPFLIAVLLVDFLCTFVVIVYVKLFLFFTNSKYDYFVIFNEVEAQEWKLIKQSGKRGYLIKNSEGVIAFVQDISTIKFKEVKRKKTKYFRAN